MTDVTPRLKQPAKRKPSKVRRDARELRTARLVLMERSAGRCEAGFVLGCTGVGKEAHHVKRRSQGGTNDPDGLVWTCEPCHRGIHANPESAREAGLLAPKGDQ